MPAHVRLHGETFCSHLFAKRTQRRHRVDARVMALLPLQTAHLRNERLGPANLHAVNHVCNFHTDCLNLRKHDIGLSSVFNMERSGLFDHLGQCIRFVIRSMMYISNTSNTAKPAEYGNARAIRRRGTIIPRCRAIS